MREECGTVTEKNEGSIKIESDPETICASCAARGGCLTAQSGPVKSKGIWVQNTIGASVGDMVVYSVNEKGTVAASLILYLLPVVLLLAGAMGGMYAAPFLSMDEDGAAALGGTAGLFLSFIVLKLFSGFFKNSAIFQAKLVKIMDKELHSGK